jgi:hypothetical protein
LVKKKFDKLIDKKKDMWEEDIRASCERMEELADYFSGK